VRGSGAEPVGTDAACEEIYRYFLHCNVLAPPSVLSVQCCAFSACWALPQAATPVLGPL
jgi:hypothetical protein